jgi:hypothetical protein
MRFFEINTASLSYRHTLELAGVRCDLRTNGDQLGSTLDRWCVVESAQRECKFRMQVLVAADVREIVEGARFRGMHHVVVASFGLTNVVVFDLLRRDIAAIVSERLALDRRFWDELLLPIAVGVLGAAVGIVPVHCACLSIGDEGLLVAGVSGAGKSTLSAAMAQCGFDYVSDDWTYFSGESQGFVAHGMTARMKLLPDAIVLFPGLARHSLRRSLNGELAYEVPASAFGARLRRFCEPRWGVFLERTSEPSGSEFTRIPNRQVRHYMESSVERLPRQLSETVKDRGEILDLIAALPWWRFRYGGAPQFAARELLSFVSGLEQEVTK